MFVDRRSQSQTSHALGTWHAFSLPHLLCSARNFTNESLPNGVLIPSNRHTSQRVDVHKKGATSVPDSCHPLVQVDVCSAKKSNKSPTLSGTQENSSSKNAHNNSPTSKDPGTSWRAPWMPIKNNRGINGWGNDEPFNEPQGKRPQEVQWELPESTISCQSHRWCSTETLS